MDNNIHGKKVYNILVRGVGTQARLIIVLRVR